MVEIVRIVGEVGFYNVGPAVAIVVRAVDSHPGLLVSIGAVGNADLGTHFSESTFAVVPIQQAGRGIIGHIEIDAPIFVVVEPKHAEPVVLRGIDIQLFRHIRESSVAIVVVKAIS